MASQEKLSCLIDHLQVEFSSQEFSIKQIITDILLLDIDYFTHDNGHLEHYKFDTVLKFEKIRLYFGLDEPNRYMLVMGGQAMQYFRNQVLLPNDMTEKEFLGHLLKFDKELSDSQRAISITKIDPAIDDYNTNPYFTPSQMSKKGDKKLIKMGDSDWARPLGYEKDGMTVYVRPPSADDRLRIYNKQKERLSKPDAKKSDDRPWIRTELVLRRKRADKFVRRFIDSSDSLMDFIKGYLKFRVKIFVDETYTTEWRPWTKFLGKSKEVEIKIETDEVSFLKRILSFQQGRGGAGTYNAIIFALKNNLLDDEMLSEIENVYAIPWSSEIASNLKDLARRNGQEHLIPAIKAGTKNRKKDK